MIVRFELIRAVCMTLQSLRDVKKLCGILADKKACGLSI